MSKLYPPSIQGTIPAQTGEVITIPYEMNKAVSLDQVSGFKLKIKNIQSNKEIGYLESDTNSFILPENLLVIGCFYKVQMAYVSEGNGERITGYYSTVGVMKYIEAPSIEIENHSNGVFLGCYVSDGIEKLYSYQFKLYDSLDNLIEDSGELLHNNDNDVDQYESCDEYIITTDLKDNERYVLTYSIKTINGYEATATKSVYMVESIDSNLKTSIVTKLNYENGYIDISLINPDPSIAEEPATGNYTLLRASSENNYASWSEVLNFNLYNQLPSRHLWKDMTIKQGVNYKYAVQQYNSHNLRSNRIESEIVAADFEDSFLYDGKRQLKIKFNPKVSSFKNTLLESKTNTIGSKYPFIFRNGNVLYKEFPISGLLSYFSDEEELFYTPTFDDSDINRNTITAYKKIILNTPQEGIDNVNRLYVQKDGEYKSLLRDIYGGDYDKFLERWTLNKYENYYIKITKLTNTHTISENIKTTNLTSINIAQERNFKLEALTWLTNGEPKLFRSPTEGNYLVRLLNVSMSPEDKLGRMLHTFSCTAYEVADSSYASLKSYGIIDTSIPEVEILRFETLLLNDYPTNVELLNYSPATSLRVEDAVPGSRLTIVWSDGSSSQIAIGITGSLLLEPDKGVEINSIKLSSQFDQGQLTYSYYSKDSADSFDQVESMKVIQVPSRMFIGSYDNILEEIENVKQTIEAIGKVRFYLRDSSISIYDQSDNDFIVYSYDEAGENLAYKQYKHNASNLNKVNNLIGYLNVYPIYRKNEEDIFEFSGEYCDSYYVNNDFKVLKTFAFDKEDHMNTQVVLNDETIIDLWDTNFYEVIDPSLLTSIKTNPLIICEITYRAKEITYGVERNEKSIIEAKEIYEKNKKEVGTKTSSIERARFEQHEVLPAYNEYLDAIKKAIGKE